MFCVKCGAKIENGAKFCGECGSPVINLNEMNNKINENDLLNENETFQKDNAVSEGNNQLPVQQKENERKSFEGNFKNEGDFFDSDIKDEKTVNNGSQAAKKFTDFLSKIKNRFSGLTTQKKGIIIVVAVLLALFLIFGVGGNKNNIEKNKAAAVTTDTTTETTTETTTIPTYQVYLEISSSPNVFFSTYDIEIYFDGVKLGNVANGKNFTSMRTVEEGEYKIDFYKNGDHSISATEVISIYESSTFKCTLNSKSIEIAVTNVNLIPGISESEIEMDDVVNMNLAKAVSSLELKGFINVNYKSSDGTGVLSESNWIVTEQSITAGTKVDKNAEIILTCKRSSDYLSENFDGLTYPEAMQKINELGFNATLFNALTSNDITKKLSEMSDDKQKLWKVKESSSDSTENKAVNLYLIYTGNSTVPNVVNMNLSEAINKLQLSYFSNIEYKANDDRMIFDTDNWTVIAQSAKKGEKVKADSTIVLTCKSIYDSNSSDSSDSTTKQKSTTEKTKHWSEDTGYSGIYAYKEKGKYNYIIIDLDNDAVYFFSDDNAAQKYKIISGDLNTQVKFCLPGESNIYWAHFRFKNRPERLYLGVGDRLLSEDYYETNLNSAINSLNSRDIV